MSVDSDNNLFVTDLIGLLLKQWRLALIFSIIGAGLGVTATFLIKPLYRAEVVVVSGGTNELFSGSQFDLGSAVGGLASLGSLGLGDSAIANEAIATLKSKALIKRLINENRLLPVLYSEDWDDSISDWKQGWFVRKDHSDWTAIKLFQKKVFEVVDDKKSKTTTISVEWGDKQLAADWANKSANLANEMVREKATERAKANLLYLRAQLEKTSEVGIRQTIYRLTETEMKRLMLAEGSNEYAFKIIDPALPPMKRVYPKMSVFFILGAMVGFAVFIAYRLYSEKRSAQL